MNNRLRYTSLVLGILAALFSGCQPEETVSAKDPQEEAPGNQDRTAWVDAERISAADAEPHNWLAHGSNLLGTALQPARSNQRCKYRATWACLVPRPRHKSRSGSHTDCGGWRDVFNERVEQGAGCRCPHGAPSVAVRSAGPRYLGCSRLLRRTESRCRGLEGPGLCRHAWWTFAVAGRGNGRAHLPNVFNPSKWCQVSSYCWFHFFNLLSSRQAVAKYHVNQLSE